MNYEANLSAQQAPQKKNPRISSPHEKRLGQENHQSKEKGGPQEARRIKNLFPKSLRLRKRRNFLRVLREKKRLVGCYICIDYRVSHAKRLGISVSTRYGNSPERNRFKRLVREAFRRNLSHLPFFDLNVLPRTSAKRANYDRIERELKKLLIPEGFTP